jgi:hypothetical protein
MHISSTAPVTSTQPNSPCKSKPPGLANRDLDLPPGIAKKLAAGGVEPPGITRRFGTPTTDASGTDPGSVTPPMDGSSQDNTQSVDLLA